MYVYSTFIKVLSYESFENNNFSTLYSTTLYTYSTKNNNFTVVVLLLYVYNVVPRIIFLYHIIPRIIFLYQETFISLPRIITTYLRRYFSIIPRIINFSIIPRISQLIRTFENTITSLQYVYNVVHVPRIINFTSLVRVPRIIFLYHSPTKNNTKVFLYHTKNNISLRCTRTRTKKLLFLYQE